MIPKQKCPYCDQILWDDNPNYQPEKGMYAICIYCGEACIFDKKLNLQKCLELPSEVRLKSTIAKTALKIGISLEQVMKDELIKDGHIKSH